jgi:aspartyl protease family protein
MVAAGFGTVLMLLCIGWAALFARSSTEQSIAIYSGAAIGIAIAIGRAIAFAMEIGLWPLLRNSGVIVGLFTVLIGIYAFRHDTAWVADRMLRELDPAGAVTEADGTIALSLSKDGHYYTRAEVNGVTIKFMIDTGATGIVLTPNDARRAGFDVASLSFTEETETANGIGRAAVIELDDLRIAHLGLRDLPARVNQAAMSESLLGMEFLRRLNGWRVERGVLLLEP